MYVSFYLLFVLLLLGLYIYNNLNRFDPSIYKKNDRVNPVFTGDSCSYVEGYGDVNINVNILADKQLFLLKNVAYIPGFHTNIVSHRKLRQAGYH